jgi:hypothetical protein
MEIKNTQKLSEQISSEFPDQRSTSSIGSDAIGITSMKDSVETYSGDSFSAVVGKSSSPSMDLQDLMNDVRSFLTDQGPMNVQDPVGGIFAFMMEYQKLMNVEARQDHKMQRASSQLELLSKDAQLDLQNTKIDEQKQEAAEKFSTAMNEVSLEFIIGLAGNLVKGGTQKDLHQMSTALDALKQHAAQVKDQLLQKADEESGQKIVSRYQYLNSLLGDDNK